MNPNDLQPLMALLEQTEQERDAALSQQQRALADHDAAVAQAEQLVQYRREYEQRWGERFAQAGHIELVHSYHGFMNRLTLAVEHQARVVSNASAALDRAGAALVEQEMRVASVRKLIERRVQEMQRLSERREQGQLDELAARAAWNRLASAVTRF
jgi:flagellar FliJ protein